MQTIECLNWLKQNNLYNLSLLGSKTIKRVFTPCLGVKDEKILIIGDIGFQNKNVAAVISGAYYLAAEELKLDAKLLFQQVKSRGDEADPHVLASLSELENNSVIVLNMSDKLGGIKELGKSFRKWVKKSGHRFVSAMSLGDLETKKIDLIIDAIDVPYKAMQAQHTELKRKFDDAKEIRINTEAGTDIYYNVENIKAIAADGNYTEPGSGGNLPAGEVYLPPNGKKIEGKVVIDGSSRTHEHTILIKNPIELKIEQGNITEIKGGQEARKLESSLEWAAGVAKNPGSVRRICELGVGLNPKAKVIGAMIIDDKTLGTAHIGIGSNYWFGGNIYAIIHLDQVFRNPRIYLDGEVLRV